MSGRSIGTAAIAAASLLLAAIVTGRGGFGLAGALMSLALVFSVIEDIR